VKKRSLDEQVSKRVLGRVGALGICLLCLSLGAGCRYVSDRASDFGDILSLGFSDGGGLLARASATRLVSVEVGARKDETFYGLRRDHFHWVESSYGFPFSSFWSARMAEEPYKEWLWTDIVRTSHSKLVFPESISRPRLTQGYEERSYHLFVLTQRENARLVDELDVEVSASALIAGVTIVASPGELLDFLAGLFTLDLAGDDGGGEGGEGERDSEDAGTTPEEDEPGSDRVSPTA
jgi:hypothetical protein